MLLHSMPLAFPALTLSMAALYWKVSVMKVFPEPEWECVRLHPPPGAAV